MLNIFSTEIYKQYCLLRREGRSHEQLMEIGFPKVFKVIHEKVHGSLLNTNSTIQD